MTNDELRKIITKGSELLNIHFNEELLPQITNFSNGMASVCHQLCLNVCLSENIYKTFEDEVRVGTEHLHTSLHKYLEQCSDTIKKAFDIAFKQKKKSIKFNNSKIILYAMSELPIEGVIRSKVYQKILKKNLDYPQGNMTRYINFLCQEKGGGLLRFDSVSGRYSFKNPIYKAFAQAYFIKNKTRNKKSKQVDFDSLLSNIILEFEDLTKKITFNVDARNGKT